MRNTAVPTITLITVLFNKGTSTKVVLPVLVLKSLVTVFRCNGRKGFESILGLLPTTMVNVTVNTVANGCLSSGRFGTLLNVIMLVYLKLLVCERVTGEILPLPGGPVFR